MSWLTGSLNDHYGVYITAININVQSFGLAWLASLHLVGSCKSSQSSSSTFLKTWPTISSLIDSNFEGSHWKFILVSHSILILLNKKLRERERERTRLIFLTLGLLSLSNNNALQPCICKPSREVDTTNT